MGKVEGNKQKKERNLLETAFELFTSKGFAKTSVSDIAEQAGVAKGTFYLYFRDKYEIQERLIVRKAEHLFLHALSCSHYQSLSQPADRILAIVDDILEQMQREPELLRFIDKNLSWGIFQKALHRSGTDYMVVFQDILGRSPKQRQETELLVYTVIELVGASCHNVILEQNPTDLATYKPYLYRSIRAILTHFSEPLPAGE